MINTGANIMTIKVMAAFLLWLSCGNTVLSKKQKTAHCLPCHDPSVTKLSLHDTQALHKKLPGQWTLEENNKIFKTFTFQTKEHLENFVNKITVICEQEDHHANMEISPKSVNVIIYTHAINGLSYNDFILADKIIQKTRKSYEKARIYTEKKITFSGKALSKWTTQSSTNYVKSRTFLFDSFISCVRKSLEIIHLINETQDIHKLESYTINIQFNQLRVDLKKTKSQASHSALLISAIDKLAQRPPIEK